MKDKVFSKLIENRRSQLYKLTVDKGLNLGHPEVIKKSQELDYLINVHNSLMLNKEIDLDKVMNNLYKFKD